MTKNAGAYVSLLLDRGLLYYSKQNSIQYMAAVRRCCFRRYTLSLVYFFLNDFVTLCLLAETRQTKCARVDFTLVSGSLRCVVLAHPHILSNARAHTHSHTSAHTHTATTKTLALNGKINAQALRRNV